MTRSSFAASTREVVQVGRVERNVATCGVSRVADTALLAIQRARVRASTAHQLNLDRDPLIVRYVASEKGQAKHAEDNCDGWSKGAAP